MDQKVGYRINLTNYNGIDIDKIVLNICRNLLSWMRINLHYQIFEINKIYIPLIWIVQNGCQSTTAMVRPLNKNDVNSSWKSQTKSMKWDFNNAHIVIESQNFYFYIKSIWYKMLNLNFSKIEMLKELEHWL